MSQVVRGWIQRISWIWLGLAISPGAQGSEALLQSILAETSNPGSCGSDDYRRHPELEAQKNLNDQLLAAAQERKMRAAAQASVVESVYTLPVVFHIIHVGEPIGIGSNISDAQVESAIVALNQHYRKVPGSTGDGAGVDSNIQFVLAKRDPYGNASNGIVRVNGSGVANYATMGIEASGYAGAIEEDVKALSTWPRDQYVNVWVVNEIANNNGGSGIQGYAYFPVNLPIDGIVVLSSAVGTMGTAKSYTNEGKVLSHEVGHYLNLYHTFNSTSACGVETNCSTQGDRVCDTPPTPQGGSCSSPQCSGTQQVQNYMDYTSETCQDMFSQGQKDRMRSALEVLRTPILSSLGGVPVTELDAAIAPYGMPASFCNSVSYQPKATLTNVGSTTITTATVRYRVDGGSWESVAFSGAIASGSSTIVTLPALSTLSPGGHTIEFNVTSPNGGTDLNPSNDSSSLSFTVPTNPETINVKFTLDYFGSENTYVGTLSGVNVFSGGPFADSAQGTVVNNYHCLAPGCYTVTVSDLQGDGQRLTNGSYSIINAAGTVLAGNSGDWGFVQTHTICVGGASGGTGGGGGTPTPTPTPTPAPDTTAPSVSISAPSNGTILNSTMDTRITLLANATDNVGINRVEFYRGTTLIGQVTTSPYSLSYNTSTLADGSYTFKARAVDTSGNSAYSTTVSVVIDRTLPTGALTAPSNLATLTGTTANLTATASDASGVERVDFFRNGTLIFSDSTSPYGYTLDLTGLSSGTHTIGVRIYDTAGNVFIPSSVNVIYGTATTTGGVSTVYSGVETGCFTRSQVTAFMSSYGCTSACNATFDVNGDGAIDGFDLTEVLGRVCHE